MGKRKSSANAKMASRKKPAVKLDTTFFCPFCNHPGSVDCKIDVKLWIAEAVCFVCKERYSTKATALTEPVDIYADWIDACEKANDGVVRRDDREEEEEEEFQGHSHNDGDAA